MNKDWNKIIHETYELLFKYSEPSVDFNNLLKEAKINPEGQKEIPYMDYEIDMTLENNLISSIGRKYKLNKLDFQKLCNTVRLGCSPKYKK